jgi:hypothetical protein
MSTNNFLLLLISLTCSTSIGCKSKASNNTSLVSSIDSIRKIEKVDTIYLPKRTNNNLDLGFKKQELGAALGIGGICLHDNYIYISDNYYGNIKKVNLKSKKIDLVSNVIDSVYKDLGSLYYQNDTLICLSTFQDKVYYLNLDLKVIGIKKLRKSHKEFRIANDKLYIYSSMEGNKLFDSQLNNIPNAPKALSPFSFTITNCENGKCLKTRLGTYQIKNEVRTAQFLEANNLVFDEMTVVYFDDRPKDNYTFILLKYYLAK